MPSFKDKNHLMRLLKTVLGIYSVPIPVSDEDFYNLVIQDMTLPDFSVYCPYRQRIMMDIKTDAVPDEEDPLIIDGDSSTVNNLLRIPKVVDRRIIGVSSVNPYNSLSNLSMSSSFETLESYQDLAQAQELANLASAMIPPKTFEFIAPDKIRLYNNHVYNSKLIVEVAYVHHPELHTIPEGARSSFFKLALLDAKIFLYNTLKHYNGIETAYGHVDLKIDDWSGAEGERADLINQWDDSFHLDQPNMFWI
jgi:hypothetical protein